MHEHVYTFSCWGEIPASAGWLALTTGKGRVISILLDLLMQRALMQRLVFGSLSKKCGPFGSNKMEEKWFS